MRSSSLENPEVSINLLGTFRLAVCGNSVTLPPKAQVVLACLAVKLGEPVSRERLADLAWSRSGPEQARQSLRQALVPIRQALAPVPSARISSSSAEILALEGVRVDLQELERLAKSDELENLARASDLYKGPFLAELPSAGEAFEDWRRLEQARVLNITTSVLTRLAERQLDVDQFDAAIAAAQHLVTLDPLREDAHRLLIRAFALGGRRSEALRQYEQLSELLRKELGVAPDAATRQLVDGLREAPEIIAPPIALERAERPLAPPTFARVEFRSASPAAFPAVQSETSSSSRLLRTGNRPVLLAAGLALIGVIAAAGLSLWQRLTAEMRPLISVAALVPQSKDEDAKALANALTMRLLGGLGNVPTVRVQALNANAVASDYRVEGSVETGDKSTHVEGRLIDARTEEIVASAAFDAPKKAPLEMQDVILGEVGRKLTLAINNLAFPYRVDTPEKTRAVELMESARRRTNGREDPGPTMALFQQAIALDPNNLEIAGSYANALVAAALDAYKPEEEKFYFKAAQDLLEKLDVKGHYNRLVAHARCQLYRSTSDLYRAFSACDTDLRILPWSARVYKELGYVYMLSGQTRNAYETFRNAERLQPNEISRWMWAVGGALTCLLLDRNEEAFHWLDSPVRNIPEPVIEVLMAVAKYRTDNDLANFEFKNQESLSARELIGNWFPNNITYGADMTDRIARLENDMKLVLERRAVRK